MNCFRLLPEAGQGHGCIQLHKDIESGGYGSSSSISTSTPIQHSVSLMLGKQGHPVNLSAALPEFSTPFIRRHTSAILYPVKRG